MAEYFLIFTSIVIGAIVGIGLLDRESFKKRLQADVLSFLGLRGVHAPRPKLLHSCFLGCFAAMVVMVSLYSPLLLKSDLSSVLAIGGWGFVGFLTGILVNLLCYGFSSRTGGILTGAGVGIGIYLLLWHTFLWWADIQSVGSIFWIMDVLTPVILGTVTGASCGLASVVWFKRLPELES